MTVLAAAMLCSLALPASASVLQTGSRPFNDVVRNSWYYNYVYSAYDQGVFAGVDDHTFGTNTSMTRGMMVTVLYGMAGKPAAKTTVPFTDVEPSRYYAGPVAWAYEKGIVQGLSETVFAPDMNISREQTALILEKYAETNGVSLTYKDDLKEFEDAGDVSDWAEEALRWAVENKIISGKGKDLLKPADTSTRAELATMLMAYRVRFENGKVSDYNPYLYTDSVLQGYSTARSDYWFGTSYDGKNRPSESVRFQSVYGDKFNTLAVGSADYKSIYLTFDEGYENGYTPAILDTLKNISPVLRLADVYTVKGDLVFPKYDETNGSVAMAYAPEFTDLTENSGAFTTVSLGRNLAGALVKISRSLINNAGFDVVGYAIQKTAEAIAKFLENELLMGTGASGHMTGVAVGAPAVTAAATAAITIDDLIATQMAVKQQFRDSANACWIMKSSTLTAIRQLKATDTHLEADSKVTEPDKLAVLKMKAS